jgi:pimeloyl-ACP methyl ester carboxylesterase
MVSIQHRFIETNGIRMHIAEAGAGPLVLLCHGFPESWYSWRHQLQALADAGFHAVAPDMRGYGQTDAPQAIEKYTLLHLVGDVVGLVDVLGEKQAVIAGHDWGAPVAWHAALLRPDIFRGVVGLSVPHRPRSPMPPTTMMPRTNDAVFYQLYFQAPGVAEAEFERDPRRTIHLMLFGGSGDGPLRAASAPVGMVPVGGGFLRAAPEQLPLTDWLTQADIDFYAAEFARTGFRGGLNWYRNFDRNWELTAAFAGVTVRQPALFIAGAYDAVIRGPVGEAALAQLPQVVPGLRRQVLIPGAGHWVNQERPDEVNAELVRFLREL